MLFKQIEYFQSVVESGNFYLSGYYIEEFADILKEKF